MKNLSDPTTTTSTHPGPATLSAGQLAARLERIESSLLTKEQRLTMHTSMCNAVLAVNPTTTTAAVSAMTILARFLHDRAPTEGGHLWDYLTDVNLASWLGVSLRAGRSRHTLRTRRGVLEQIIRVHRGGPVKIANVDTRRVAVPPLSLGDLAALGEACATSGPSAMRGFASAIGAGARARSHGQTFVGSEHTLRLVDPRGRHRPVVDFGGVFDELAGQTLLNVDWDETCRVAFNLRLCLNPSIAMQSFRLLALNTVDRPLFHTITRHNLDEQALNMILEYLPQLELMTSPALKEVFRDGGLSVSSECTEGSLTAPLSPVASNGWRREDVVPRKISRAQSRRLAKEIIASRAAYTPPIDVALYIDCYLPDEANDTWVSIEEDVRAMLRLGQFRTVETTRKYAVTLTAMLRWRAEQRLPTTCPTALTFINIDGFYAAGLSNLGTRSKADYRSRLRTLASRVNTGASAPPHLTTGYNVVRQGYSAQEEAVIRRAALNQRRPVIRRRLCSIVGLSGGGGLAPSEVRWCRSRDVEISDEGIVVHVRGENARCVIIRRAYEPLVLVGIEGVGPDDLLIDVGSTDNNAVGKVIRDAELYAGIPKIDARRLRTTWISWLLQQSIPLQLALQSSGLRSARTFTDMVAHLTPLDDLSPLRDGEAK